MIEVDAKILFESFMSNYVDEMARTHKKRCDCCFGDGYYGYVRPYWSGKSCEVSWFPCPRCLGSGLQYAE